MLSTGCFPLPCSLNSSTTRSASINYSLSSLYKTHRTHLAFFSNASSAALLFTAFSKNGLLLRSLRTIHNTHMNFCAVCGDRCFGLRVYALKKQGRGEMELFKMDNFDDGHDDDDDDDDELVNGEDIDEEDDDESIFLPFGEMKKWLENKPRGFGEDKEYDTSIEDKLFEEMEQSRKAQAANLNKLKNNSQMPSSKQDGQKKKVREVVPSGVRVQVVNLPRKKNVHRDLTTAFKGVPGIISINPVVSGNKKTRDPICKGYAFVDFKSEEEATRFIQMFTQQSITFGKVQKRVKCEMVNSLVSESALQQSAENTYTAPQPIVPALEGYQSAHSDVDDSALDIEEESNFYEYDDPNDNLDMSEPEDIEEKLESVSVSELSNGDSFDHISESKSLTDSFSSKRLERVQALEKKLLGKGIEEKVPEKGKRMKAGNKKPLRKAKEVKGQRKLDIPGSAKRLKIKEKAVLTDVFSKYGTKSAMTSKEDR
ncbi:hypothetical protein FNV43_RR26056 [Rhamnella rubrinervis]|uniref:RRM domain-containing protein n=1 Tax=Rhamnella rubrinervis TaxID=2594499 RepID=A0A8K0DP36_9ROSA|nr:hypothetical protein FNV43_RR26056 [Rhamnella rubrinervis]